LIGYAVALLTAAVLVNRLGSYAYLVRRRVSPELMPPRVSYTGFYPTAAAAAGGDASLALPCPT